ncbi:putative mitochondrial GPI transamidase component Tta1, putative (TTA1) [Leptomonas pyrrhocoris]|uniref:Putative mitochondrial GPI transamidase component Tta1, putative (TTA1) n=1 Tax=Leptomonas pyrrhocoris TaxID=157538 RepID=A0A0N0VH11_LEPPY|nr:putative mitochondrial GPI transamidase component Tta1, putative (TTA1) [Leptomonas pyrrhocoris]KPA84854.1 putative mitochondrial GPI transamidase component Tta1, putative (TTA1) [Leptomonas pyrrhocoris]|eukprot:XP_015663293.1 putative mitochondrial GPI transamidase component Tta1, putative (TTA1) [Leptomonas pyrrhocoris]
MSASTAVPGSWRRHSTKEFTALFCLISLVVFLVHQTTLSHEKADLPMDRVLAELQSSCPVALRDGTEGAVAKLPPAFFGLGVWVDTPALLPGVHAALALMKERLAGDGATAFPPPTHSLHSFVRVESHARDTAVAELVADAHRDGTVDADRANRKLELVSSQQQLGMLTMKHAFLPQIGQEIELHGLSLFSVPAEVLPEGSRVRCYVAEALQAYCAFPVNTQVRDEKSDEDKEQEAHTAAAATAASITAASYRTHADSLEAEIRAALLSVMARQMELRSFKPADVAAWKQRREEQGCVYTTASVKSTLRSITANANMVIPLSTRHMFADLEQHVHARAFVRAARAADDLQFHPSLTPQLYIPWDHSLVSQLVILLPIVSMTILSLRFVIDERRARRARAAAAVSQAKKVQ